MIVGGFDLSLTATGVAYLDTQERSITPFLFKSKPGARVPSPGHKGKKRDPGIFPVMERAQRIRDHAHKIIHSGRKMFDLAVIEAPSYASKFGRPHERSGLAWFVTIALWERGIPVVEVPPRSRAMYATGDGSADKAAVVAAMQKKHILSFSDDNIIDAIVLAEMGCRAAGHPFDAYLPHMDAALGGVYWNTKGTP